jgi:hypothetical protein
MRSSSPRGNYQGLEPIRRSRFRDWRRNFRPTTVYPELCPTKYHLPNVHERSLLPQPDGWFTRSPTR